MEAKQKIDILKKRINRHNYRYYVEHNPTISDQKFDQLLHDLQQLEKEHPEYKTPDSPTQRVGGEPIDEFKSVDHPTPMYSIDNTYNEQELKDFHKRVTGKIGENPTYTIEPKIDGLAINLIYVDGILVQALTRGDGKKGDDVTHNIKTIHSIPLRLQSPEYRDLKNTTIEVRGEIFMSFESFEQVNKQRLEEGKSTFANPRNAAAGTVKLLDPKIASQRKLEMIAYDIGIFDGFDGVEKPKTYLGVLNFLHSSGFTANKAMQCNDISDVLSQVNCLKNLNTYSPFPIDGVVIKVNSRKHRKQLGFTSKAPRFMVAYKFEAEQATSCIESVTMQVGRTGQITPVAELTPTDLCGTTIKRASLHNFDYVCEKDIMEGDTVIIEKAGEIIPQVVRPIVEERDGSEREIEIPKQCPVCKGNVDQFGAYVRCVNINCREQVEGRIKHFCSRDAMDIQGLGASVVSKLINSGLVQNPADLYTLTPNDFMQLDGIRHKSGLKLVKAIQESKNKGLSKVLYGLGIPHVGRRVSKILAEEYGSMENLCANLYEVYCVGEIGCAVANSLKEFFDEESNITFIEQLDMENVKLTEEIKQPSQDSPVSGKKFVLTGSLQSGTRKEISEKIMSLGGETSSSVSKNTDYLLVGENPGSKLQKAEKLEVEILTEEEFLSLIGD